VLGGRAVLDELNAYAQDEGSMAVIESFQRVFIALSNFGDQNLIT
jgi:hypothetical protein